MPKFDRWGRMKYDPEIHINQGKCWTTKEIKYLIEYYYKIGPSQLSFDLERTLGSIQNKATTLRHQGLLAKPKHIYKHKRY